MRTAIAFLCLLIGSPAIAHQAPMGWAYDFACCSEKDCREVPSDWVVETAAGITMVPTGDFIPAVSKKIRQSKDDRWHWCTINGSDKSGTICIYRPMRGF